MQRNPKDVIKHSHIGIFFTLGHCFNRLH